MLSWENMESELVESVPELRDRYQRTKEWWGGEAIPQHVLGGDLLAKHIAYLVDTERLSELQSSLLFLERLSSHFDNRLQEVASLSVLSYLEDEPRALATLTPLFGAATLRLVQERVRGNER